MGHCFLLFAGFQLVDCGLALRGRVKSGGVGLGDASPPAAETKLLGGEENVRWTKNYDDIHENDRKFPLADDEDREFQRTKNPMSSRLITVI